MSKKSRYKAKYKAKNALKKEPKKRVKNLPKKSPKSTARNKKPNKRKPPEKNTGATIQVKGGGSPALVIFIVAAVLAATFLIACLVFGYHAHWDKNSDHYCDVLDCNACMPVDEDGDGLCDICGGCANAHSDKDKNCECDRCGKEVHVDEDGNRFCDNCGEWMPETGIGKGIKGTLENIGKGIKRGAKKVWDWAGDICKDIGNWVERWWPGHVCYDNNGDGWCDDCVARVNKIIDNGCEHIDENGNGLCDKCHIKLVAGEIPSDCKHTDLDKDGYCDECNVYITGSVEDDGGNENENPPSGGNDNGEDGGENKDEDEPTESGIVTVTFNPGLGTLTGPATMQTGKDGKLVELPSDPVYEAELYYIFLGWTYEQMPMNALKEDADFVTLHDVFLKDTTVYAWFWHCTHEDLDFDTVCDRCGFEIPGDVEGGEEGCENHVDENEDRLCDNCGELMSIDPPEGEDGGEDIPPEGGEDGGDNGELPEGGDGGDACEHMDMDGNGVCDLCGDGDDHYETPPTSDTGSSWLGAGTWTEEYVSSEYFEVEDDTGLPFEYCVGSNGYHSGIKIRPDERFEQYLTENGGVLNIPSTIDGYDVAKIDEGAFSGSLNLVEVYCEGPLTIGKSAFRNCANLKKVTLQDGSAMDPQAFAGCEGLDDINLGDFAYVGDATFSRNGYGTSDGPVATFYFGDTMTLEEFCTKYYKNEWEHCMGEKHGAFHGIAIEYPTVFVFSDCTILYYDEDPYSESLLEVLHKYEQEQEPV